MSGLHLRHWPGDGDRPALALHCMMGSGSGWGPIARLLDGRVDLRAFDMPGHGRSDDWQPQPDGPDYHTAVTRLAAAMINRPLDLIGHSFGATVALRIAVAAPEAVRSLTLIEPVLFAARPDPAQDALDARMGELLDQGHDEQAMAAFLSVWGAQDPDRLPPRPAPRWCARSGWSPGRATRCAMTAPASCARAGWNRSTRRCC
ncbi:alpha/beta fold hydrolase [Paracoccus sp. PAMC 22219]|uniref:alpha/beta fold hydrolase n=1 Tax=Paracoccus sp. PAMC 22219 TaxID=1569209 RepID=UPI000A9F5D47|nr:alpha/beta fold hydrolase [Paracoccus sp. PAMC 22219]